MDNSTNVRVEACLNCSHYTNCDNQKKSFGYYCNKYKPVNYSDLQDALAYSDKKVPKNVDRLLEDAETNQEFNIKRIVEQVLNDKSMVPIDIRINDRHIPKAANFFEFCTGEDFLKIKPFVEQCIIGSIVFCEICTRCSNMDWILHDHKVDDTLTRFTKRVALLENGECPYCGTTKSKLVKKQEANFYREMAIVAGQRCVTGDTLVKVDGNIVRIDSLDRNYPYGFTPVEYNVFNGRNYEKTSHYVKVEPEPIFKIVVGKYCIKGTCDHPILTTEGFVKLGNITVGTKVFVGDDNIQYANIDIVTSVSKCEPQITYDFTLPDTHCFWSDGFYSHNSGKSALTAMMFAYHIHKIVMLKKPNEVYGLLHSNIFHISLVALTFNLAKELLFDPLFGYLSNSKWFIDYHELLNDYQKKTGETIFKLNDTFLMYRHRALVVAPNGPDRRTLRGKTRIGASIDEAGHFQNEADSKRIKLGAQEVYIALERSLLTVRASAKRLLEKGFNDIPTGYFLNISSPFSVRDKIMELYRHSLNSTEIYGLQRATWLMNPTVTYADLQSEFTKDPITAMRDYGAQPPLQSNAFIQSEESVQMLIGKKSNGIKVTFAQKRFKNGDAERYAKVANISTCNRPTVLAIDAGYCVSGNTLIPTEHGIVRIDSLIDSDVSNSKVLNLTVGGCYQPSKATYVHYNGVKTTLKIMTRSGHQLEATFDHKQLVLRDGEHLWIQFKNLQIGDFVCFNTIPMLRTSKYELNLSRPKRTIPNNNTSGTPGVYWNKSKEKWSVVCFPNGERTTYGDYYDKDDAIKIRNKVVKHYGSEHKSTSKIFIRLPKVMSPKLAYFLGALISEGSFKKYRTDITNSNLNFLNFLKSSVNELFCIDGTIRETTVKGDTNIFTKNNTLHTATATKSCYSLLWLSKELSDVLFQLGIQSSTNGNKTSYIKTIPDCIMQADYTSQQAFLAAYIEGDGQIRKDRYEISVWSKSKNLLRQLQVLYNAHGVMTIIKSDYVYTASASEACKLYTIIEPFLIFYKVELYKQRSGKVSNKYGFSSEYIIGFLRSRYTGFNKHGTYYIDDNGNKVHSSINMFKAIGKRFLFEKYERGDYKDFLSVLQKISNVEYAKLRDVVKYKFWYSEIVTISESKNQKVYDLTMKNARSPAFTANGMVTHNCNNSFAFVCGYLDKEEDVFTVTIAMEVMPLPGIPLNYTLLYNNIICSIIEAQNVVLLCADRWNSIKILSDTREQFKIATEQYSLKYKDMWYVKDYITENKIILPSTKSSVKECIEYEIDNYPYVFEQKPIEHLILQMLTVRDNGSSIIKGDGDLTDDIFRALCLAIHRSGDEKNAPLFNALYTEENSFAAGHLAVVKGMSNTATVGNIAITGASGKTIAVARRSR